GLRRVLLDANRVASGGSGVLLEDPSDLTFQGPAIEPFARALDPPREAGETLLDALGEARVHRLLFLAPIRRAAEQESLLAVRPRAEFRLDSLAYLAPVLLVRERMAPLLELALGRANQVA